MVPQQNKSLVVRIPNTLHRRLKVAAAMADRSIQEVVIDALLAVVEHKDINVNSEPSRA